MKTDKHEKFEKREVFSMLRYADNDQGYIQCVIKARFKADFIKLGFVDHIDKVKKPKKRAPNKVATNEDQQSLVS
jgi:hypothetical protein